jgi:hypothetical protein
MELLTNINKFSEDCQKNLKIMAELIQSMGQDFEELADSCKHINQTGGCTVNSLHKCSAFSCPLPNKEEDNGI